MHARFDDLTPGSGRSFRLDDPIRVVSAASLDEVTPVVAAAEQAAMEGHTVAGFIAYEAAPAFDPALEVAAPDPGLPLVAFGVFPGVSAVAPPQPATVPLSWEAAWDEARHRRGVEHIRERIAAGDTYQANLTFPLRAFFDGSVDQLYAALGSRQRGAHHALVDLGDVAIASASPELFFELDGRRLTTRPMKGTAPRGRWAEEDRLAAEGLRRSEKERAENLMIVDLLRNDLGRVSRFGSVEVSSMFDIERLDTVWQMTSTISSVVRPDVGLVDVFAALFPCGSVTGAPKASTMRILRQLEQEPRGVYCGAIGFIEPGGKRAVFSVPIRTAVVDRREGIATYRVGGGVTWDSSPDGEFAEALLKAAVLDADPVPGLIETMRVEGGSIELLDRHLARLEASAGYLRIPFDRGRVADAVAAAVAGGGQRLRLVVTPEGAATASSEALPDWEEPVVLGIDTVPIDPRDPLLFHKTTRRTRYEEAAQRHPAVDEVVLVNGDGHATETTVSTLLCHRNGRWVTPPISDGCLPGVARAALLESGEVVEESIPIDALGSSEVEVVNALRGRRRAVLE